MLAAKRNEQAPPAEAAIERLRLLREEARGWRAEHPRRTAAEGVERVYRDGRRQRENCGLESASAPWHEWRKSVKYHGYHAQLLQKLHPVAKAYAEPWDRLGKLLGDEHDLSVLDQRLVESELSQHPSAGIVADAVRQRRAVIRRKASRLGKQLYRPSSRAVRRVVRELLP